MASMIPPDADDTPRAPNTTVSLEFDLFLTPKSPLIWFTEALSVPGTTAWHNNTTEWTALGAPVSADAIPAGRVSYRLGPNPSSSSQLYMPLVGRGVRVNGNVSIDYDGWLGYVGRDGSVAIDGRSDLLYQDDSPFTRRQVNIHRSNALGPRDGLVDIANITVRTGMNTSATSLIEVPTSFAPFVSSNGTPNPAFQYIGTWAPITLPDKTLTLEGNGDALLGITVPRGTAFMVVNGTAGPNWGALSVAWRTDPPPLRLELTRGSNTNSSDFPPSNSSRPFIAPREMLYYAALDPAQSYSLNLGPHSTAKGVALHSVTFYSGSKDAQEPFTVKEPSEFPGFVAGEPRNGQGGGSGGGEGGTEGGPGGKGSKTPIGAIVGGVVGGVVALLLLGALVWWLRRRKARAQSKPVFDVDGDTPDEPMLTPFETAPASIQHRSLGGFAKRDGDRPPPDGAGGSGLYASLIPTKLPPTHAEHAGPAHAGPSRPSVGSNMPANPSAPDSRNYGYDAQASGASPLHGEKPGSAPAGSSGSPDPATGAGPAPRTHEEDAGQLLPPMYNPAWTPAQNQAPNASENQPR